MRGVMNNIMIRHNTAWFCVPLLFLLSVFGCYPAPKAPIDTLRYDSPNGDHTDLFVYLPGNGDPVDAFDREGLVQAVRHRRLPIDIISVNAHIGYYMKGTVFNRLKHDVIDPAKAKGYTRIWLVGNSLGGYGSVSYVRQYPQDIAGIILLGPFLGDKKIIQEIREAGGLQEWEPGEIQPDSRQSWEKELWKWLKDGDQQKGFWNWIKNCDPGGDDCPSRVYLGYGKRDRFSFGQKLMAEKLPPENVFEIDGGHNWKTWKTLWEMILDRMPAKQTTTKRADSSK